jgi:hypothetical protein
MTNDSLWVCIKSVAAVFDGDRRTSEAELGMLEAELMKLPAQDLTKLRQDLVTVIGGLARLEMRLSEQLGINDASI